MTTSSRRWRRRGEQRSWHRTSRVRDGFPFNGSDQRTRVCEAKNLGSTATDIFALPKVDNAVNCKLNKPVVEEAIFPFCCRRIVRFPINYPGPNLS